MTTVKQILQILDEVASFDMAENWDNCGLQVGNESWSAQRIMIALDVTMPLMAAAGKWNADLVVTHHPLLLSPEKQIDFSKMPGSVIEVCAQKKISIISLHTNLDKALGGLNDYFAQKIGLTDIGFFTHAGSNEDSGAGIGRTGNIKPRMTLGRLAAQIKERLGLPFVRMTGPADAQVGTAAVCTGSGGSLLDDFFESGADVYITGDMKYHDARKIEENNRFLVDVGHFGSEHIAVELLYEKLMQKKEARNLNMELNKFTREQDPFTIV